MASWDWSPGKAPQREPEAGAETGGWLDASRWGALFVGDDKKPSAEDEAETGSLLPGFLQSSPTAAAADSGSCGLSKTQRFRYFVALLVTSAGFFALSVAVLPVLLVAPAKFAVAFTVGSLLFLGSFAMLRGPREQCRAMCSTAQLPFTTAYVGSMLATLYAALVARSYVLVVAAAAAQVSSLLYYWCASLPGGRRAAAMFSRVVLGTAKAVVKGGAKVCFS